MYFFCLCPQQTLVVDLEKRSQQIQAAEAEVKKCRQESSASEGEVSRLRAEIMDKDLEVESRRGECERVSHKLLQLENQHMVSRSNLFPFVTY